jgi:DNA-binding NarL/FixJ family response regulator
MTALNVYLHCNPIISKDWDHHLSIEILAMLAQSKNINNACLASNAAELRALLSEPIPHNSLVILCVKDRAEMEALLELKNYYRDMPIIILLNESSEELVTLGHSLVPRYLSFLDEGLNNASLIINKMANSISH